MGPESVANRESLADDIAVQCHDEGTAGRIEEQLDRLEHLKRRLREATIQVVDE